MTPRPHAEIEELLGAYALDAVDADERAEIDSHLASCPRCRDEVAQHRDVAASLAHAGGDAPPELWDRIAAELGDADVPPPLSLTGMRTRRWLATRVFAAAAIAASIVIALLTFKVADDGRRVDRLARALHDRSRHADAVVALTDPNRIIVALRGKNDQSADVVVLPDGRSWLIAHTMPSLGNDRTYQLWALVGDAKISLGVLGPSVRIVAFHVAPNVRQFAVTDEVAGGVAQPEHAPVLLTA